jgi:hypothetical protein
MLASASCLARNYLFVVGHLRGSSALGQIEAAMPYVIFPCQTLVVSNGVVHHCLTHSHHSSAVGGARASPSSALWSTAKIGQVPDRQAHSPAPSQPLTWEGERSTRQVPGADCRAPQVRLGRITSPAGHSLSPSI